MCTDRRDFLRLSLGLAGASLLGDELSHAQEETPQSRNVPESMRKLKKMTDGVVPITLDERIEAPAKNLNHEVTKARSG